MTRRRQQHQSSDSLDMLLDTITNTFGGILLVALLLVLLVRDTTIAEAGNADEKRVTVAEQKRLEMEVARLRERQETLQQSQQMLKNLESKFGDASKQQVAKDLVDLLGELNSLQQDERQLQGARSGLVSKAQTLEQDKVAGKQDAVALSAELASAELALKNELALRTRTMELPREEYTNKSLACVFLLGGKIYFPDKGLGRDGFMINAEQFEKCLESQANLVLASGDAFRIKTDKGGAIERSVVQRGLQKLVPSDFYLTVVCDRESFASFGKFKDILVELGYEHRILPLAEPRVFETTSRDRAKVQ